MIEFLREKGHLEKAPKKIDLLQNSIVIIIAKYKKLFNCFSICFSSKYERLING